MDYEIRYENGHVRVLDGRGDFLFSADTAQEALEELRESGAA